MSFKNLPVGTSLALETIAAPNTTRISDSRDIPKSEHLDNIELIIFDVFTLARDVINSIPKEQISLRNAQDLLQMAIDGIKDITELVGITRFINSYDYMKQYKDYYIEHRDGTVVAIRYKLLNDVMSNFTDSKYGIEIDRGIPFNNALLYSHHAYFLAKMIEIGKMLTVLESHTGRVLVRNTLGLKYRNVKKYDRLKLPFNRRLLLVLGDGIHIRSESSKIIDMVIEVSSKWTPLTPDDTIKLALKKLGL